MNVKQELSVKEKCAVLVLFFISLCTVVTLASNPSTAYVRLDMLSPGTETFQLFWSTEKTEYSQKSSSITHLEPGKKEYRFKIDPSYRVAKLRLDPSVRPSTIVIESLALEWDGECVFKLAGEDLKDTLVVVQDVKFAYDQLRNGVVISSIGSDPIVELDMTHLKRSFIFVQFAKQLMISLLFSMIFMASLLIVSSKWYIGDSHCTYPERKRHWLYWGMIFFLLGMYFTIVTPAHLPEFNQILYFAALSYVIGASLFIPAFWLSTRKLEYTIPKQSGKYDWFWFALPSLIIWLFYLLSFWPGSLSPDSLDQWEEVIGIKAHFRDWNPAFHTMTIWLITRIKLSPASVAIVQILALGSTVGWALSIFQRYGFSKPVLWFTSLLFALLPVNGFMVITLWKDILYSIVLLILAMYVFQIVMENGLWLIKRKNLLFLGGVLALVSLYRHNGIIPAALTGLLLLCCYLKYWKGIIFASMLALLIHIGVRGPLYNALEVERGNPMTRVQQRLKNDFLQQFTGQIQEKNLKKTRTVVNERAKSSNKVWDRIYSASVLWRIQTMDFFHKRIEYVNLWQKMKDGKIHIKYVSSNRFGVEEDSLMPAGMETLYVLFNDSRTKKYLFWMWRPAVYLYALMGLLIITSWRCHNKLYLILAPALFNSLPIFLVVIHKSIFRYHYPLVVLGILYIVPLLFLKPLRVEEKPMASL